MRHQQGDILIEKAKIRRGYLGLTQTIIKSDIYIILTPKGGGTLVQFSLGFISGDRWSRVFSHYKGMENNDYIKIGNASESLLLLALKYTDMKGNTNYSDTLFDEFCKLINICSLNNLPILKAVK